MHANLMTPQTITQKFNLPALMEDLFLVLTPKEKEIVTKRFQLSGDMRATLQTIGNSYAVTRERVRQIEKSALTKLRRTSENTKLTLIMETGKEILQQNGGMLREDFLVSEILKQITSQSPNLDAPIVRLALSISTDFEYGRRNTVLHPFWRLATLPGNTIKTVGDALYGLLLKKKDVTPEDALMYEVEELLQSKGIEVKKETASAVIDIDRKFKRMKEGVGLMAWRHINPRSIRDKAYVVMKRHGEPLHFTEIANKIIEAGFDKKPVTTQAVHNELIRDEKFVLVGRGLYALKDWGFLAGTVADIIADILSKKGPLHKKEIIALVMKQRKVQKGTISLNLQNSDKFKRVGRATYALKD